ncbi:MAG: KamA family radical SAM protein [Chlamydiia bacterium]|nr:KamA family radical SAM protein [Chlamydiia bacterium]
MQKWKDVLRSNFTDLKKLLAYLEIEDSFKFLPSPRFRLNVPMRLAEKMAKGELNDPLLKQFVPFKEEGEVRPGFEADPVQDQSFVKTEKLLQKYSQRALVISTSACAMHCRYCFRQNFPYESERKDFHQEVEVVANNPMIKEVILSGGDPLSLPDSKLKPLLMALDEIPHVKRIRFHSRFVVGIPERVDDSFLSLLSSLKTQVWFVTHINHAKELDDDIFAALKRLQRLGIPVMNQAVLLKGVNDSVQALKELSDALADNGVVFYYLHQLDRVKGAHHFEVDRPLGKQLIHELQALGSGYQVPKYVEEIAGESSKTLI